MMHAEGRRSPGAVGTRGFRVADDEQATAISALIDAVVGPTAVGDALEGLGLEGVAATDLAERAHRARAEHTRLRRREHELSALFSSARELAELRDTDAVLARLVQRAQEMMGVDVTYLSEFDAATRELRVRETAGSVSAEFQHLRVPPGRGLASVVVEGRAQEGGDRERAGVVRHAVPLRGQLHWPRGTRLHHVGSLHQVRPPMWRDTEGSGG